MDEGERRWWERVRRRGAMWYVVSKGLAFLLLFPLLGHRVMGWDWEAELLVEGWCLGLVWGGLVWMRKELRYRYTLEEDGLALPDGSED